MKRILRLPEVKKKTGLSRSTIYAFMKEEKFPTSINLGGGRAIGWIEESIDNWIDSKSKGKEESC